MPITTFNQKATVTTNIAPRRMPIPLNIRPTTICPVPVISNPMIQASASLPDEIDFVVGDVAAAAWAAAKEVVLPQLEQNLELGSIFAPQ
jgi:hypothetical protein